MPNEKKAEAPLTAPAIRYINGQEEVKQFPELDVFERQQFVNLLEAGNEAEIVLLCTREKRGWVKSLTFETYMDLANYFVRRNFPWVMDLAAKSPITGMKMAPVMAKLMAVLSLFPSTDSASTPENGSPSGSSSPSAPALSASADPAGKPASETPPPS